MSQIYAPKTAAELSEIVLNAGPFRVEGLGSKRNFGHVAEAGDTLSLASFSGVDAYEPEELILDAGAATPLAEIEKLLAARNQMLAFDPPDHAHLWGTNARGSLGGMLATGIAGSRRLKMGSVRDHVLGVQGVTGRGEIFKAGARVVKNVTGYDMPKLMAGSFGTLAAMTSVIFKVLPAPETEETIFIPHTDDQQAMQLMSDAMQSSEEVSCAAHLPGEGTCLRLEGTPVSVAARRDRLTALLKNGAEVLPAPQSRQLWTRIRDCKVFAHDASQALWRISVAPMQGAAVAKDISTQTDCQYYFDWGGGLLWLSTSADGHAAEIVRAAVTPGHATLYAAPENVRQTVAFLQPQQAGVAALSRRVKTALDPHGKLNPGRMYRGV